MPTIRRTTGIEVGPYEGRPGFLMRFADGTSEAFVFDLATMESLCRQGLTLVEALHEAAQAPHQPASGATVGDMVSIRLVT